MTSVESDTNTPKATKRKSAKAPGRVSRIVTSIAAIPGKIINSVTGHGGDEKSSGTVDATPKRKAAPAKPKTAAKPKTTTTLKAKPASEASTQAVKKPRSKAKPASAGKTGAANAKNAAEGAKVDG